MTGHAGITGADRPSDVLLPGQVGVVAVAVFALTLASETLMSAHSAA